VIFHAISLGQLGIEPLDQRIMSPKPFDKQQQTTTRNSKSIKEIGSADLLGLVGKNWALLLSIPPFLPHFLFERG